VALLQLHLPVHSSLVASFFWRGGEERSWLWHDHLLHFASLLEKKTPRPGAMRQIAPFFLPACSSSFAFVSFLYPRCVHDPTCIGNNS
jgi:hypothetical protein